MTEAGGGWYEDPHDYYTPQYRDQRFAKESGERTRTQTFYGICFDYAQTAYEYIARYKSWYNDKGMQGSEWYIAGVYGNSSKIYLFDPTSPENTSFRQNGVPVKTQYIKNVSAHGQSTYHAWIWIQHKNGTWFWVDPTWTDNCGYPVYGYVKDGKEIQLLPDNHYCIVTYSKPTTTKSQPAEKSSSSLIQKGVVNSLGFIGPFNLDSNNLFDSYFKFENFGIRWGFEDSNRGGVFTISGFNFLFKEINNKDNNAFSFIWDLGIEYSICSFLQPYIGAGLGFKYHSSSPNELKTFFGIFGFAWKVNGGLRFNVEDFYTSFDVSYGTILGLAGSVSVGYYFR